MTRLRPPRGGWQLLVVNNNCTDETDAVLEAFAARLPLRRVFEPNLGHSNARNAAVAAAEGEYLVWTDDDVLVDTRWLCAYERAFELHPSADFFGGPVTPWFEGTAPAWIGDAWRIIETAYAARDLGDQPFALTRDLIPFGANFAVRREAQRRHRYDPALGRVGTGMMSGDEVAVLRSILRAGGSGWWVPDARVEHFIPAARQSTDWVRKFHAGQGEQQAREELLTGPTWFGRPRWLWREAIEKEFLWRWHRAAGKPAPTWVGDLVSAAVAQGKLRVPAQPVRIS
jgi:GT2 family glycosyltransferase